MTKTATLILTMTMTAGLAGQGLAVELAPFELGGMGLKEIR